MPGPLTLPEHGLTSKDSSEALIYRMDYDTYNLAEGVELASAGTFAIAPTGLTQDNAALTADNRSVTVRLSGGTVGVTYRIEHTVTTAETPSQTKSKYFRLRIT